MTGGRPFERGALRILITKHIRPAAVVPRSPTPPALPPSALNAARHARPGHACRLLQDNPFFSSFINVEALLPVTKACLGLNGFKASSTRRAARAGARAECSQTLCSSCLELLSPSTAPASIHVTDKLPSSLDPQLEILCHCQHRLSLLQQSLLARRLGAAASATPLRAYCQVNLKLQGTCPGLD